MSAMGALKVLVPTRGRVHALFKAILLIVAILNIKSWPLFWHGRFYSSLFRHLIWRRQQLPEPSHLFAPISSITRSPFYECDLNLHKSNSSYNSDLDIARTHLFAHLIKRSLKLRQRRGEPLYVALAGVNILFRREIKPFQKYEIVSRVLAWDDKWFWVVSHFVKLGEDKPKKKPGSRRNSVAGNPPNRRIFASALSKYVFKSGRITVKPEVVLQESGLLPARPAGQVLECANGAKTGEYAESSSDDSLANVQSIDTASIMSKTVGEQMAPTPSGNGEWTWERIEAERKRGMETALHMLSLDSLDHEFKGTGRDLGGIGLF